MRNLCSFELLSLSWFATSAIKSDYALPPPWGILESWNLRILFMLFENVHGRTLLWIAKRLTHCNKKNFLTWNISATEGQLPHIITSPSKWSSSQGEGKAVVPTCSHLCQGNAIQGLHLLRAFLGRELLPQAKLPMAVAAPGKQLAIYKNKEEKVKTIPTMDYQIPREKIPSKF